MNRRENPDSGRLRAVGWRERGLALGSLSCGLLLTVAVVVFGVRNLGLLVLALVGLAVTVSGLWWVVSERMPRRGFGIAGGAVGVLLVGLAIVWVTPHADRPLIRLALLAVLLVGTVGLARAALMRDLHEHDARRPVSVERPHRPVLICNPWSGGGKVAKFGLVDLAKELGVEVVMLDHGLDLGQLARDAIASGADCLGMAGGDGSQALVASIAIEHGLPFVCVSAGTRNHFALDLGIDREDPRLSLRAFRDGIERRIDYATVGDRLFVNNVSLGIYATIVQQEGYRDAKSETTRALLPEMLGRTQEPFDLQFTGPSGIEVDGAFLLQVSNNPYVLGATLDASQRRRLDTGKLGIVAISASSGARRPRCSPSHLWASAAGAGTGTSSPLPASKFGRGREGHSPVSTAKRWNSRPRWSSRSIRGDCACWSPRGTSLLLSAVGHVTSRSPTCSPSPAASTR